MNYILDLKVKLSLLQKHSTRIENLINLLNPKDEKYNLCLREFKLQSNLIVNYDYIAQKTSKLINSKEQIDLKILHKSFVQIESKLRTIVQENKTLKEEIRKTVTDNRELANMYQQKLLENHELHKELQSLKEEKRTGIELNIFEPKEKTRVSSINQFERKESWTAKQADKRVTVSGRGHSKSKKRKSGVVDICNNIQASEIKITSNLSKRCNIHEKIWVCFGCMPPQLLSEDKFLDHSNYYLHLNSCIAYNSEKEARAAVNEYLNVDESSVSTKNDENTNAHTEQVSSTSTPNDDITMINDDVTIKREIIDLAYSWDTDLDNKIGNYSSVANMSKETVVKGKSKAKVIRCSKCWEEFPTRERKLLHTCNSISDKYYVSKE